MPIQREDLELLQKAIWNWLSIEEVLETAQTMVAVDDFKKELKRVWNEIYRRFSSVVDNDIEKIMWLSDEQAMMTYIIWKAFWEYTWEKARLEAERERLQNEPNNREEIPDDIDGEIDPSAE